MRARNLKPGFFKNEDLAEIEPLGRLFFQGLWCMADREGRLEDRLRKIKAEILPYDDCNIKEFMTILHEKGFIIRYSIDSKEYVQICNFNKHQNPHLKETPSNILPPPGHTDSGVIPFYVPPHIRDEIFFRDNYKCKKCGTDEKLSIDHIVPRSKGGTNDKDNLQTLCIKCNSGKGNRYKHLRKKKSTGISGTNTGISGTSPEKFETSPSESPLLNLDTESSYIAHRKTDAPPKYMKMNAHPSPRGRHK